MKYGLGQELSPGNKVVWVSGKSTYVSPGDLVVVDKLL